MNISSFRERLMRGSFELLSVTRLSNLPTWTMMLIVVSVIAIVYGQALRFDFVNYDDNELIYQNEQFLSQWSNMGAAFTNHVFMSGGGESVYYRPLLLLSFIVDYHVWKINPLGFHLVNILLHICATLVLFHLVVSFMGDRFIALLTALLFALHPIQTESVAWIAGRNDVLLGIFVLLMVFLYIRFQQDDKPYSWQRQMLVAAALTLALLTKESAAFYVVLLPLYDLCFRKVTWKHVISRDYIARFWMLAVVIALYVIVRLSVFGVIVGAERLYGSVPMIERIGRIPAIVTEHILLLVVPLRLSVSHPMEDLLWFRLPWSVIAVGVLVFIPIILVRVWRVNRSAFFGMAWVCVGFLPVLGLIPMPLPILEHRLYVPMAGFAIAIALSLSSVKPTPLFRRSSMAIAILIVCVYSALSFVRLPTWKNSETLFTDAVEKFPQDGRSYFNLAGYYYDRHQYDSAITLMKRYVELAPDDVRGLTFLRQTCYVSGRYSDVAAICNDLIRIEPTNPRRYLEAGVINEEMNVLERAEAYYQAGVRLDDTLAEVHFRLGEVYARLHRGADAEREYGRAIALDPKNPDAFFSMGKLLARQGTDSLAVSYIQQGLQRGKPPADVLDLMNLLSSGNSLQRFPDRH